MAKRRRAESSEDLPANQSGGVDIDSQDTQVHGDVTGRDKVVNINGDGFLHIFFFLKGGGKGGKKKPVARGAGPAIEP